MILEIFVEELEEDNEVVEGLVGAFVLGRTTAIGFVETVVGMTGVNALF